MRPPHHAGRHRLARTLTPVTPRVRVHQRPHRVGAHRPRRIQGCAQRGPTPPQPPSRVPPLNARGRVPRAGIDPVQPPTMILIQTTQVPHLCARSDDPIRQTSAAAAVTASPAVETTHRADSRRRPTRRAGVARVTYRPQGDRDREVSSPSGRARLSPSRLQTVAVGVAAIETPEDRRRGASTSSPRPLKNETRRSCAFELPCSERTPSCSSRQTPKRPEAHRMISRSR